MFWPNVVALDYEIAFAKKTSKFVKVCQGKLLECLLYQKLENLGIKVRILVAIWWLNVNLVISLKRKRFWQ